MPGEMAAVFSAIVALGSVSLNLYGSILSERKRAELQKEVRHMSETHPCTAQLSRPMRPVHTSNHATVMHSPSISATRCNPPSAQHRHARLHGAVIVNVNLNLMPSSSSMSMSASCPGSAHPGMKCLTCALMPLSLSMSMSASTHPLHWIGIMQGPACSSRSQTSARPSCVKHGCRPSGGAVPWVSRTQKQSQRAQ